MALGKIGAGLGALALAATVSGGPKEAAAENVSPIVLAAAGQTVRSVEECKQARRDGELDRAGFRECKREANAARIEGLDAQIAEQQRVLAALREQLAQYGLQLNSSAQILDEGGQLLAQIVAINGKLVLRDEIRDARAANLDQIRAYLAENS